MKKRYLFSLLGMLLLSMAIQAQPVPAFYFQDIALNSAGQRLANHTISLRSSVMYGSLTGTLVYSEKQLTVTNASGQYTIQVGQGLPTFIYPGQLPLIQNPFYLKVEMDPTAGNNYIVVSRGPIAMSFSPWQCGSSLIINHIALGGVAPVNKTVTYGTTTNIPGEPTKCWITSNLGADHQAASVDDATEASAGWYWQFNREQGYKHVGSTLTPACRCIGHLE